MSRDNFEFVDICDYEILKPHEFLPNGGLQITWYSNTGFGNYTIMFDENGRPCADTEYMDNNEDKWFTKKLLMKLAEEINIV